MIAKIIPATEKESSATIRLTPVKIGELLAKVQESDLPKVAEAFMQARSMTSAHPEDTAALFFNACCVSQKKSKPKGAKPTHELSYRNSDNCNDCIFQSGAGVVQCYDSDTGMMAYENTGAGCGVSSIVYVLREIKR